MDHYLTTYTWQHQVLGYFYPKYMFWFQLSVAIDIASHWIHTQVSLMTGKTSHKTIDLNENPILRLYYTNRIVLFSFCFANEVFYFALYMLYFYEGPIGKCARCNLPGIYALLCSYNRFVYRSVIGSVGFWRLCVYLSGPVSAAKTVISVIQMVAACMNCKEIDMAERRAAAAAAKAAKAN